MSLLKWAACSKPRAMRDGQVAEGDRRKPELKLEQVSFSPRAICLNTLSRTFSQFSSAEFPSTPAGITPALPLLQ